MAIRAAREARARAKMLEQQLQQAQQQSAQLQGKVADLEAQAAAAAKQAASKHVGQQALRQGSPQKGGKGNVNGKGVGPQQTEAGQGGKESEGGGEPEMSAQQVSWEVGVRQPVCCSSVFFLSFVGCVHMCPEWLRCAVQGMA